MVITWKGARTAAGGASEGQLMAVIIIGVHLQNSYYFQGTCTHSISLCSSNSQGKAGQLVFALVFI